MITSSPPRTIGDLEALVSQGEGKSLELKRSTAELQGAMQSLCAFLNSGGGVVLIGVASDGSVVGQPVSDDTQKKIAALLDHFEPPAPIRMSLANVDEDKHVIVLIAEPGNDSIPFTFEGRPFERVGSTTRRMPQARYERLLIDRAHSRIRWENLPAERVSMDDLDREEILRTRELGIHQGRMSAETPADPQDILVRLGLLTTDGLTRAAQVLYGSHFLPDYPQCVLKMGRFRGTTVTGDILDNRQERLHAFDTVKEGLAFLERTLPLRSEFPAGRIEREDRLALPRAALREIILNAVIHRDYSNQGGHVAIAVFDDRVEVRSVGILPADITVESLSGPHSSSLRNPLIAEAFHRTGAVEVWGRGTNRVIDECRRYEVEPPQFREEQGVVIVTFPVIVAVTQQVTQQVTPQVTPQVTAVLQVALSTPQTREQLQQIAGIKDREHFRTAYLEPLLKAGWMERTIPEKPKSRMQQYRTTEAGRMALRSADNTR